MPLFYDTNTQEESLSLARLPGGNVSQEYYDGTLDKQLNYELQVKVKPSNRDKTVKAMTLLTDNLIELQELSSSDGSFSFNQITVGNELYMAEANDGFLYFRIDFQPLLTIYQKGENE